MKNKDFVIENGVLMGYKGNNAIVIIPNNVSTIETFAFRHPIINHPNRVKTLVFSEGVKTIKKCAVSNYWNLEKIHIPKSVVLIEEGAFKNCPSIKTIDVEDNNFYHCDDSCLIENQSKKIILGNSKGSISTKANSIGAFAFLASKRIFELEIPTNIVSIQTNAFAACAYLTEVKIQNGCREILDGAFSFCHKLRKVYIPKSVQNISRNAFEGCENIAICSTSGSYAEQYAKEKHIPFVAHKTIDDDMRVLSNNKFFLLPIESLNLSAKTNNCLLRYGIRTVKELVSLKKSQVQNIRGIGESSLTEICDKLDSIGLFFSKL